MTMQLDYEVVRVDDNGEYLLVNFIDQELQINMHSKVRVRDEPTDLRARIKEEAPFGWFEKRRSEMLPPTAAALEKIKRMEAHIGTSGTVDQTILVDNGGLSGSVLEV